MMTTTLLAEIPDHLAESVRDYLASRPEWDRDRLFTAAIALFLLQYGEGDSQIGQTYLSALFNISSSLN